MSNYTVKYNNFTHGYRNSRIRTVVETIFLFSVKSFYYHFIINKIIFYSLKYRMPTLLSSTGNSETLVMRWVSDL